MTTTTKALALAEQYATPLREAGWDVTITTDYQAPEPFPHDPAEVMLDGRTFAHVFARKGIFDGTISFGFCTRDGAAGRATTRYLGGKYHPFASGWDRSLYSYRKLSIWVSILADR